MSDYGKKVEVGDSVWVGEELQPCYPGWWRLDANGQLRAPGGCEFDYSVDNAKSDCLCEYEPGWVCIIEQ